MEAMLKEDQFLALCHACDRVLLHQDAGIECQAIPWLHVIREHPVFIANYRDLFGAATPASLRASVWCKRHCVNRLLLARQCFSALSCGSQGWFSSVQPAVAVDVLFVSHLINAGHAGQLDDFYFFGGPRELCQRGITSAIALLNHTKHWGASLAAKWPPEEIPRAVLGRSVEMAEEFRLRARMLGESRRLKRLAAAEPAGLYKNVLLRASQEALSSSAWATLRMAEQFASLVRVYKPKVIVTSYEGHPWERMAFAAARSVDAQITCVAYQHAALFRLQHAARRNLAKPYNPDHILTSGVVAKEQLEQAPLSADVGLAVLGSGRRPAQLPDGMEPAQGDATALSCLVLPDGEVTECNILFEFSIQCALAMPQVKFVWRLHPLLSHEQLAAKNPALKNLPDNIILSRETMEQDLARCSTALYRGTTAIIQAIASGLRPIYLARDGEMTIDPLYDCDDWRAIVLSIEDFKCLVAGTESRWSPESAQRARRHCENFFTPFDIKPLHDIIVKARTALATGKESEPK